MAPWRRLLVGTLLTLLAAIAILAVGLAWRLSLGPIPLPSLDRRLEAALSGIAVGVSAQVEHTEIAWLRHLPELRVLGVKLEQRGGKLLLSMPSLGIRPSLRALMHGQLAVERVTVTGVHVSLVRDESGGFLLGSGEGAEVPLVLSDFAGSDGGGTGRYFKRLRIRETDIRLDDRAAKARWRMDDTRLELTRERARGGFAVDAQARLRVETPRSSIARLVNLPFSAAGFIRLGEDGGVADTTFDVKVRDGNLMPAASPAVPLRLRSLAAHGALSLTARTLEIATLHAAIGSAELDAKIKSSLDGIRQGLDLTGEIRSLPVAELQQLWPPTAAPATHDWIVQHINGGAVPRGRFAIHVRPGEQPLPANAVAVAFDFEGLTVDYLSDLTPVDQVRGSATLDAERFEAQVNSGAIGRLKLDAGSVDIRFRGAPPWLKVGADVSGATQDVLAVLERPPLQIPQAIGIPAANVAGTSASHVDVGLPLKHGLHSSDIVVGASGHLYETRITDLYGTTLTNGDLQVRVDGRRVDVEGDAGLEGLPVPVERSHLVVGFAPGDGAPDQLSLSIEGSELRAKAKGLVESRALTNLKVEQLQLAGSDLTGVVARQSGGYHVSVDGSVLDVDRWFHGSGSGSQIAREVRVPYDVDFRLQRVRIGKGVELSGVQGVAHADRARLASAHLTAATAKAGTLRIDLIERDRARHLDISASDAGSLLKALGIFEDAEGGQLALSATVNDGNPKASVEGQLDVHDFRVTRAPVLARVLSIGSLQGIAELLQGGGGLTFSRARVPFSWSAGTVTLHEASAIGAIGITADGRVQHPSRTIEIRGNIFPAYTLNSALGKIPFIGKLVTGGEDQGIFGIEFRVDGKLDSPEVQVNALTALAPGFLRKMFVEPFKHDEKASEEHSQARD